MITVLDTVKPIVKLIVPRSLRSRLWQCRDLVIHHSTHPWIKTLRWRTYSQKRKVLKDPRFLESLKKCPGFMEIHPDDMMYKFLVRHTSIPRPLEAYTIGGLQCAQRLEGLLNDNTTLKSSSYFSLLEFAAGYGRVTRHMKSVFPFADIVSCDIHPEAVDFVSSKLNSKSFQSVSRPSDFNLGRQFDCVFALSFFSHVPKSTFRPWINALYRHTAPGGCFVFTTHGLNILRFWNDSTLDNEGFYFKRESEQLDLNVAEYGNTVCSPAYVRTILREIGGRLVFMAEGYDDGHEHWSHQDTYVVIKPR